VRGGRVGGGGHGREVGGAVGVGGGHLGSSTGRRTRRGDRLVRGIAGGTGRGRRLSRGTTLLDRGSPRRAERGPLNLPAAGSTEPLRPAWPVRQGRSSGGSGVIWSAGLAPGLTPSPGRSWPRSAAGVPINAFADCHDI